MNTKHIIYWIVVLALVVGGVCWYVKAPKDMSGREKPGTTVTNTEDDDSFNSEVFSGKLDEVNVGCYVDGECYVVVGSKHVTVIMGWSQETVGSVQGVDNFGELNNHIGEEMEVYAKNNMDGTYTLYDSADFYVKLK